MPTIEEVRAALRTVQEADGPDAVAKLLNDVAGVTRFSELPESKYGAAVKAAKSGNVSKLPTQERIQAYADAFWTASSSGRGRTRGRGGRGGQGGGHDDASE